MAIESKFNDSLNNQIALWAKERGLSVGELLKQALENKKLLDSFTKKDKSSIQPDSEKGGTGLGY